MPSGELLLGWMVTADLSADSICPLNLSLHTKAHAIVKGEEVEILLFDFLALWSPQLPTESGEQQADREADRA